jgi:hypothetical protein
LALALLGAIVVYSAVRPDGLPRVVPGVAAAGLAVAAVALIGRWPALVPVGVAGVGAGYALFLRLERDTVDPRAPVVAAMLLVAAELAFWSIERRDARVEAALVVRRILVVAVAALGAALLGSLLLVATAGFSGGLALEAVGVLAAVVVLSIIALLAARARASAST